MAESIGGLYDIPHGLANAIYLPIVMDFNCKAIPDRYAELATYLGEDTSRLSTQEAASRAGAACGRLARDLGIPSAKAIGVRDDDLPELAHRAASNLATPDNPRTVGEREYLELFRLAQTS